MNVQGRGLALVLSALAMGALGCASDASEQTGEEAEAEALVAPIATQTTTLNPEGAYFASITANGTGCPAGTWNTDVSPDGQTFTTTFSAYEASLDPTTTISVKDCNLTIKLHSPQGLSYTVSDFYYAGYAFLDEGLTGAQTAFYYFQGSPALQTQARTNLVGPVDKSYLFSDKVTTADAVWSPCGLDRNLNVVTRINLVNNRAKPGAGYMNLSSVDGAINKLVLTLNWRQCNTGTTVPTTPAATPDAGAKDAGAVDAGVKDAGPVDAGKDAGQSSNNNGRNNGRVGRR